MQENNYDIIREIDPSLSYDGWTRRGNSNLYRVSTVDGTRALLKIGNANEIEREAGLLEERMHRSWFTIPDTCDHFPKIYRRYNVWPNRDPYSPTAILKEWIDGETLAKAPTTSRVYNQLCNILANLGALPSDFREDQFIVDYDENVYAIDLGEVPKRGANHCQEVKRIRDLRSEVTVARGVKKGRSKFGAFLTAMKQAITDPLDTSILE